VRGIVHRAQELVRRHPVLIYFSLVLLISYGGFAVLFGPTVLRGQAVTATDTEYILFPTMVLSVCLLGLAFTAITDGRGGLRALFARIGRWRVGLGWYAVVLLLPPVCVLIVLEVFRTFISPVFSPKVFALGILFGLPGFLEEIGWMGFVYPKMRQTQSALAAAIMLGVLWGCWHAPVVDYLGAAAPHGMYWLPFFLAFVGIVSAIRVLMVWIYTNTGGSLLLVQLMHISFAGSLVVLDPVRVTPAQEALWYGVYAAVLWLLVGLIAVRYGKSLMRQPMPAAPLSAVHP
jgi:membrane protease YdiL (CAAX protease family)